MPHKRAKRSVREADRFAKGHDLPPTAVNAKDASFAMPKGAMRILMGAKVRADYQERRNKAKNDVRASNRIGGSQGQDIKGKGKAKDGDSANSTSGVVKKTQHELKLLPGETLGNFNRRVEKTMASDINASLRAAASTSDKRNKKRKREQLEEEERLAEEAQKARSAQIAAAKRAAEPTSKDLKRAREAMLQQAQQKDGSGSSSKVKKKGAGEAESQQQQQQQQKDDSSNSGTSKKKKHGEEERDWARPEQRRRINDVAQAPPVLTRLPKVRGLAALGLQTKPALNRGQPN
ncbi:hypothetical protein OC844_005751 [Tilletia horrida]|nr:hypothetical protein OC844_005751 [Tilletia horrida]